MGQLEELICRCEQALESEEDYPRDGETRAERKRILEDYTNCYARVIYEQTHSLVEVDRSRHVSLHDLRDIRNLLRAYQERLEHEVTVSGASGTSVSAVATASASVQASFENAMSQMWSLPDDAITVEQKQELAKMLQDVEDSKGNEGKLKKAGKAVADWLFDNAVKAIPTVMPYVTQAVGSIAG